MVALLGWLPRSGIVGRWERMRTPGWWVLRCWIWGCQWDGFLAFIGARGHRPGGSGSPQVGTLMLLEDFTAADRWVCHGLEARIGAALMSSRCWLITQCLLVGCDVDLTPSIRAAMGAP
ncbi:hypothetical protein ACLOJK_041445 [Asimina triloba]